LQLIKGALALLERDGGNYSGISRLSLQDKLFIFAMRTAETIKGFRPSVDKTSSLLLLVISTTFILRCHFERAKRGEIP
jgi:hypothetical protein